MTPSVSIVMPVRNEATSIARTLSSIFAQDYPARSMEIVVVDGLSEDGTRSIVADLSRTAPITVRLLDNVRRVTPAALNAGIAASTGEIIIRVDGHCRLEPDYVRRCVELLAETGADNVGGVQRAEGHTVVQRAVAIATTSPFGVGNARFRYAQRREWVDTVYLGAYRREVFDRVGRFDEELTNNQDDEFNLRLTRAGGRILLDPSVRVRYQPRGSLRALWRQYFRYGLYKVRVMQKVGGFTALRHYVPAALVIALAGGIVVAFVARRPMLGLVLPAAYVAGLVTAAMWTGRRDLLALPLLPVTFALLHLAYGTGFLYGIWKWRGAFGSGRAAVRSRTRR